MFAQIHGTRRSAFVRTTALCMMLLSFVATDAFAQARAVTLTTTDATAAPGEEFTVSLSASNWIGPQDVQILKFALEYDPALLEYLDILVGPALAAWPATDVEIQPSTGRIVVSGVTATAVTVEAGELFSFRFRVQQEVIDGDTSLFDIVGSTPGTPALLQADAQDDATRVKVTTVDGTFTVTGGLVCTPGDVTLDGEVTVLDAVAVLRLVVDLLPEPGVVQACNADVDGNGEIEAGDAVAILRRVVGLARGSFANSVDVRVLRTADGTRLIVDDASTVYGLSFEAEGDVVVAGHGSSALAVESRVDGRTKLALASAQPLTTGGQSLVLELPGFDGATAELGSLRLYGADGARMQIQLVDDATVTSRRGASLSNYPNPFNPSTTIHYELPTAGRARLELFNARGERVAVLVEGSLPAGAGQVQWNGVDAQGRAVASGVYFAQLTVDGNAAARQRLVLLK